MTTGGRTGRCAGRSRLRSPSGGRRAADRPRRPSSHGRAGQEAHRWRGAGWAGDRYRRAVPRPRYRRAAGRGPPRCHRSGRSATAGRRLRPPERLGTVFGRLADDGQAEHARRALRQCHRVAAEQRQAELLADPLQAGKEAIFPPVVAAQASAKAARRPASRPWRRDRTGSPRRASSRRSRADRSAGNGRPRRWCRG